VFLQRACSNIEKRGEEEGAWSKKEGRKESEGKKRRER
jgi:hypothetical protein